MAIKTFNNFLEKNNLKYEILITDNPTTTAQQAANTHNVPVSNIVKSLLVRIDDDFKLFLVPGDRKLDLENLKPRFNAQYVRMANADEVKSVTGYSIGGVPPFGHISKLETYIEEGFTSKSDLVAAAGHQNAVFKIPLEELKKIVM